MVNILNNNEKFTPYIFYSRFLNEVAREINENGQIHYNLVENGDELLYDSNYSIEPISIPLLLSLTEQLSKFYKKPIDLKLYNNQATTNILNFLLKSDFFYVAGNNNNPSFPQGRKILNFNEIYLGKFLKKFPRPEHKVRCYSLNDNNTGLKLTRFTTDEDKRDFLISEYIYIVRDQFDELLRDNDYTLNNYDFYVEVLSELITNGVLHSRSNTFALMFVNRFSTKFSISDNGIGFTESIKTKKVDFLYKPLELKNEIESLNKIKINAQILENFNYIIETLYYSSLKNRRGLFDLMLAVVLESNGYFRLHSENSQIIISNRMAIELKNLRVLRSKLFNYHRILLINGKTKEIENKMISIKNEIKQIFIQLYINICNKYNEDYRYSSIRFYNVKFNGVHIEVEIPNKDVL